MEKPKGSTVERWADGFVVCRSQIFRPALSARLAFDQISDHAFRAYLRDDFQVFCCAARNDFLLLVVGMNLSTASKLPDTHRITLFESLRGILSLWVLVVHVGLFTAINPEMPDVPRLLGLFNWQAGYAVNVFMILSGFVIFYLLEKSHENYPRFIFRRFFRLYPVFLLALIIGILVNPAHIYIHSHAPWKQDPWIVSQLTLAQNDKLHLPRHIITHLTLLHGIVLSNVLPYAESALNGPAWSISPEWQFYLVAPFLFWATRRLAGFIIFALFIILYPLGLGYFPPFDFCLGVRGFLLTQIAWFYLGMICFDVYNGFAKFSRDETVIRIGIIVFMLYYIPHSNYLAPHIPIIMWFAFFGLVMWHKIRRAGFLEKIHHLLNHRFLQYLGKISYPVYLLHWPVIILVIRGLLYWRPEINHWQAYAIALPLVTLLTILISHATHFCIEVPAINFARNFFTRKKNDLSLKLAR